MPKEKRILLLTSILSVTAMLSVAAVPVLINNVIEIDGNVAGESGAPGTDWNLLNGNCTGALFGNGGGSFARTCIASENPPNIFTKGGSKDPADIGSWSWKPADTVPDKDAITHGFAASFLSGGDKILAMGGDRYAVNGDANIGAWFFQQAVGLKPDGTFSGAHTDKDVFLVSAFVNGGGAAVLQAYEWDHNCKKPAGNSPPAAGQCAEDNLRYLGNANTAAMTNDTNITDASWSYLAKFSGGQTIPAGGFFEGAADLTQLFNQTGVGAVPCFTSFMLETRSSQEPSAVLKDFVLGSFPECKVEVSTNCACMTVDGNTGSYTFGYGGAVHNAGGASLASVHVVDILPDGTRVDYDCGSLAPNTSPGDTKFWPQDCSPAIPNTFTTLSPPSSNLAYATASTGAATIRSDTVSKNCFYNPNDTPGCFPSAGIRVDKVCATSLVVDSGLVKIRVGYSGSVVNGAAQTLTGVVVSEDHDNDGTIDVPNLTLAGCSNGNGTPGNPCTLAIGSSATFSGSYFPGVFRDLDNLGLKGRAEFADKVIATATAKVSGESVSDNFTASCKICPLGSCPVN